MYSAYNHDNHDSYFILSTDNRQSIIIIMVESCAKSETTTEVMLQNTNKYKYKYLYFALIFKTNNTS